MMSQSRSDPNSFHTIVCEFSCRDKIISLACSVCSCGEKSVPVFERWSTSVEIFECYELLLAMGMSFILRTRVTRAGSYTRLVGLHNHL